MQHDYYRPASYAKLAAGIGADGWPVAWTTRIACSSIMEAWFPGSTKNNLDPTSVEGVANLPYSIPNIQVDYVRTEPGIPVGFWRSVGASQNGFFSECFMDELATAGKKDPYEFRRRLLDKAPRHLRRARTGRAKSGLGQAAARGPLSRHRGARSVSELRRAGGGNFGGPQGAIAESAPRGLRGGCGPRRESGQHRDAKRKRDRVRTFVGAVRRDHDLGRPRRRKPISTTIRSCASMQCPPSKRTSSRAKKSPPARANLPCRPWSPRCATRSSRRPASASAACRFARRIWRSASQ